MTRKASEAVFMTEASSHDTANRMAQPVYFEDQRRYGSARERRKKQIQDIPASLQFFYLNPRAGLTNKEKSIMKMLLSSNIDHLPNLEDDEAGITGAASTIAPSEVDKTVIFSDTEQRDGDSDQEDHDWDDLRKLFMAARMMSVKVANELDHAIQILSIIERKVRVSHRLEYLLDQRFKTLVDKLKLPTRLWQTDAAVGESRKQMVEKRKGLKGNNERKHNVSHMTMRNGSDGEEMSADKKNSDRTASSQAQSRLSKDFQDRRLSMLHSSRRPTISRSKSLVRRSESITESESERSITYLRQTVRFVMSSSEAAAKGWLVIDDEDQREQLIATLEWCVNRIRYSQRTDKQNANAVVRQFDDPPMKVDCFKLLHSIGSKSAHSRSATFTGLERSSESTLEFLLVPKVPEFKMSDQRVQAVVLADKTASVFYSSGRVCVIRSASVRYTPPQTEATTATPNNQTQTQTQNQATSNGQTLQPAKTERTMPTRFYTTVFADTDDTVILAEFQPNGNGSCFRMVNANSEKDAPKVVIWLQLNNDGYVLYDELGNPQKSLRWPSTPSAKLPGTVTLQLTPAISFRCDSRNDVSIIVYSAQNRDVIMNFDVAPNNVADGVDGEALHSTVKWKSKTARDIVLQMQVAQAQALAKGKRRPVRTADKSNKGTETPVLEDYQGALERLRRQCKQRIDEWLAVCNDIVVRTVERDNDSETARSRMQTEMEIVAGRSPGASDGKLMRSMTMPELKSRSGRVSPRSNTPYSLFMRSLELSDGTTFIYTPCPALTRQQILANTGAPHSFTLPSFNCHCSKHRLTRITDVEYETFLRHCVPARQLVIIIVVSSSTDGAVQSPDASVPVPATYRVLDAVFREMNSTRTRPCFDGVNDKYRILEYDLLTAANDSSYQQPLLLRRHNVVPGMVLIYQNSRLLFCDHMFNGYGHSRKDFQLQIQKTLHDAGIGLTLPSDFKFVPRLKTVGPIDRYGSGIIAPTSSNSTPAMRTGDLSKLSKSSTSSNFSPNEYRLQRSITVGPSKTRGDASKTSQIDINFLNANLV